jgi:bifunctional non-homologous end joining protein LigD
MGARDLLKHYRAKRDFARTPEPARGGARSDKALTFVIQKHDARNLHYDFRLELQGTLKSWAVPKGPSLDPSVKRMGMHVEDHPISYGGFEGSIPARQYGAGDVIVWDRGLWTPLGDPVKGYKSGKLKFELHGEKLKGGWTLVRMHGRGGEGKEPWLLIKERDEYARAEKEYDVLKQLPNSVLSGKPLPRDAGASTPAKKPPAAAAKKPRAKASAKTTDDVPEGATKARLPDTLAPQLATLVTRPPADREGWVYEIKYDGYRLLARIEGRSVKLFTRNGNDWTAKLAKLAKAVAALKLPSGWIDGEIVVMNEHGVPDFGALQNAFDHASTANILYYVFDLPFFDGLDLRELPLTQRREVLCTLVTRHPQDSIHFSDAFDQTPEDLLDSARRVGLEGVIGKRVDSVYVSRRSSDWIKLKTQLRQEFVIGGYTAPKGSRTGLGALMLGVHDEEGNLLYAGNVGTGFNDKMLDSLKAQLEKLHADHSPFEKLPAGVKGQWVKPRLLAEVAFGEWTHGGHIRHSVFQGLRTDKPAAHILRETPAAPPGGKKGSAVKTAKTAAKKTSKKTTDKPVAKGAERSNAKLPGPAPASLKSLRVTHADRVIDASTGFTKQNVVEHYAQVAALMLPHLKARPTSLVRAPSGIDGQLFFQKHAEASSIPGIKLLDPALDPDHDPLLEIPSANALLAATQVNVVEFHTWNATTRSIQKPDRMTFDLDPGEGVSWPQMQEAAQLVRAFLDELGLASFLKTSGGKGLHVVVPLKRQYDFDTVKDFSQAIVIHLAAVIPQRFVAKSGPKNRVGKIFADYLRNGFGATTVSAWSLRARPGMGVSVPVAWDELASLTSGAHWTGQTLGARLATGNTPWDAYEASRNSLTSAMKRLGFKPPRASTARKAS